MLTKVSCSHVKRATFLPSQVVLIITEKQEQLQLLIWHVYILFGNLLYVMWI